MLNSSLIKVDFFSINRWLSILFIIGFSIPSVSQDILINEFMASNSSVIADEFGEYDDWVELYNPSNNPVDIGGWFITDNLENPTNWQIPTDNALVTTIPANGYILLWFDKDIQQGPLHVDSKLSASGEEIGLFGPEGTLVDSRIFEIQQTDISEGRTPNGGIDWGFYSFPTPNAANTTNSGAIKADTPIASLMSGLYDSTQTVTLTTTTSNAVIYYTTDGSIPTENSNLYTSPLSITINTPLRAVAIAPTYEPSIPATYNYLIDVDHSFAVVTITSDDSLLFDSIIGMYHNYMEDIEIPAHVELIETDGTIGFSQIAEIEIQGSASAAFPQKSIAFKAKSSLGNNTFDYPVFPDLQFDEYRSLVVRNSGQDRNVTMFRDAFVSSLVRDLSDVDIIQPPKLYTQGYRPSVVYLNGEYWGVYNIRERTDKRYLKTHFDLNEDEVDMVEGIDEASLGDNVQWNNLVTFLQTTEFSDDANFDSLKSHIDTEHFMDYVVFNVFIDNWDWPDNNNKRWREKSPDGKWRFISYDHDFTFGLFTPQGFNSGVWYNNSLGRLFQEWNTSWPNSNWSTLPFRKMILNDRWKNDFINRMADQINVLYTTERLNERIDDFENLYAPEMQQQIDRWTVGFIPWEENVDKLRLFADNRVDAVRQHVVSAFNNVWGTAEVTLNANPIEGGSINFSTITVDENQFPWTGVYFTNTDIPITAVAEPGFEFTGWSVTSGNLPINDLTKVTGPMTIYANFTPIQTQLSQSINFQEIPDKWVPELPFTISAVASSGLPVTYSILSGPATISGDTITLDGVPGTVIVQVEQLGDSTYLSAPLVTQSFEVLAQQVQTIDFEVIPDQWVNNPSFQIQATASSNLPVTFSIISGPATISSNTITLNETEGIVVVQAEQNGNIAFLPAEKITQSFEVSTQQVSQIISFPPLFDKSTLDQPFQINATSSSNLPVSLSIVSGPATLSNDTITLDGIEGTVVVQAEQSGDSIFLAASVVTNSFEVVAPQSQTISFPPLADKWSSDNPFQIEATASSNLAVSYSIVSGPATISSNTITLDGIEGTVIVQADQGGNTMYLPAISTTQSFNVITPQSQSISFDNLPNKWSFDQPFQIEAIASSGLPISFSIVGGPATIIGNTITLNGTDGFVHVQAEQQGDFNYLPAPSIIRTFEVITPLNQVISFPPISNKWTTDSPFLVPATSNSGLPVSLKIISGPATITGNTVTLDGIEGTVIVQAEQSGNFNYLPAPITTQSFHVLLETSVFNPTQELDITLDVYPNPFGEILIADYVLNDVEKLEASIINVDGKLLAHQEWEHPLLENQLVFDTSKFPTGIYALIIKQGIYQKVIRVTKVK